MAVFFLVYVSAAATWFSPAELRSLLAHSRDNNMAAGVSGLLLYKDGNFMQVLEGEEATVRALVSRIAVDRRHQGVVVICSGQTKERQFADWRMAFIDLNQAADLLPAGYSDFLQTPLTEVEFSSPSARCLDLLAVFKQID